MGGRTLRCALASMSSVFRSELRSPSFWKKFESNIADQRRERDVAALLLPATHLYNFGRRLFNSAPQREILNLKLRVLLLQTAYFSTQFFSHAAGLAADQQSLLF